MVRKLLFVGALGMLVFLANCGPDGGPEPEPQDIALENLSATWKADQVIVDGVLKSEYANFTLAISGTKGASSFGYTTSGRPTLSPWRSSGNWTFGTDFQTDITRDPNTDFTLPMAYALSNDGNKLELTFFYQGNGEPGRAQVVKGGWTFRLTKQ